jgi:hypothetical protein
MKQLLAIILVSIFSTSCFGDYQFDPIPAQTMNRHVIEFEIIIGKTSKVDLMEMVGRPDDIIVGASTETMVYTNSLGARYNASIRMRDGTYFNRTYEGFRVTIANGVIVSFDGSEY